MKSQTIEELLIEIRDDPGRNPYLDPSSGEPNAAAIAWSLGHKQALEKAIARYRSIPEMDSTESVND